MAPLVFLVRHAESAHNVSKDFSHRDPPLTSLGLEQASALVKSFPDPTSIVTVVSSPLTRTLQTTLAAFGHVLDKKYVGEVGRDGGAKLILDPDLQERSDLPCDTGSDRAKLQAEFPNLDFSGLGDQWFAKEGRFTADDEAVAVRAKAVRERLFDLVTENGHGNMAVVTHGVFMKFLSEDSSIDLPKAGWMTYTVVKEGGNVHLVPVE